MRQGLAILLVLLAGSVEASVHDTIYERLNPEMRDRIESVLLSPDNEFAVMSISVDDTEDGFVLTRDGSELTWELSLYTPRQKKLKRTMKKIGKAAGLKCRTQRGDFFPALVCDLPNDPDEIATTVVGFLVDGFGATNDNRFTFRTNAVAAE